MLKKVVVVLLLFSLMSIVSSESSHAGFFKKLRESRKHATEEKKAVLQEEKKVLVVEIYASWCPGCRNIQPTLDQLIREEDGINLVQLDVSTPSKAKASEKQARDLKIASFYTANKSKTSTVGIITPTVKEIVSVFQNNDDIDDYKAAIQEAKTKEKALENPPA